jgi:hypothetical protein
MADVREGLVDALAKLVRPVVKRLLAMGVPFGHVEARLRELFVEVAATDLALPGRAQTDSRIALVTGINRKEVRRIRSGDKETSAPKSFSMNRVTGLISRWMTDSQTTDRRGRPRPLPYQADHGPSFMKLARKVTEDLAPGILLDELVRSGAAELREGNTVVLHGDTYVPKIESSETLLILAEDPAELVETILRNILSESRERLLQRKVYYDNLGSDAAKEVRAEMRREGERFVRRVNRLLSKYDRDRNPKAPGGSRYYAGIGVYFFEEPEESKKPKPPLPNTRARTSKEQKQ